MERMLARVEALESALEQLSATHRTTGRRLRLWQATAGALALAGLLIFPLKVGTAQGNQNPLATRVSTLESKVAALETKLASVSVTNNGADLFITNANLHIVDGLGTTDTKNGRGNLILGYNESGFGTPDRSGSHNLVVGPGHSYSSFGGLVAGYGNTISGVYASVSGGTSNTASYDYASVSGGSSNRAGALASSVSGGNSNQAIGGFDGAFSSVSGGAGNIANRESASVSGGDLNVASNKWASVSGGQFNTASGQYASVSGGSTRPATGDYDWRAGTLFQDF